MKLNFTQIKDPTLKQNITNEIKRLNLENEKLKSQVKSQQKELNKHYADTQKLMSNVGYVDIDSVGKRLSDAELDRRSWLFYYGTYWMSKE